MPGIFRKEEGDFMTYDASISHFPFPSLEEQADLVEQHGVNTLLFCPSSWALRHVFVNQDTGESGLCSLQSVGFPVLYAVQSRPMATTGQSGGTDLIPHAHQSGQDS